MSDEAPIVLPSLAAERLATERRGPTAAVCASGHVHSWLVDPAFEAGYCAKCGDPVLVACPACNRELPGDGEMLRWVPYHSNCAFCGKPYPWIAADVARAKRTLAESAEVGQWNAPIKKRADELIDDIAGGRALPSEILAALKWLAQQGAETAEPAILDAIERLGSADLKQALRPNFPGLF